MGPDVLHNRPFSAGCCLFNTPPPSTLGYLYYNFIVKESFSFLELIGLSENSCSFPTSVRSTTLSMQGKGKRRIGDRAIREPLRRSTGCFPSERVCVCKFATFHHHHHTCMSEGWRRRVPDMDSCALGVTLGLGSMVESSLDGWMAGWLALR